MGKVLNLISECADSIDVSVDMMPFIPELLSGLWDIGTSSEKIMRRTKDRA